MTHFTRFWCKRGVLSAVLGRLLWIAAAVGGQALEAQTTPGAVTVPPAPPVRSPVRAGGVRVGVEAIPSLRNPAGAVAVAGPAKKSAHKSSYSFTVKAAGWTDTGIDVVAGETATVTATGEVTLADRRDTGPEGLARGWKDLLRVFPLNAARTGELIGRVTDLGASVPFAVGSGGTVTMPTSGRLFLAINTASDLEGTGEFKVKWVFSKPPPAPAAATRPMPATSVAGALAGVPTAGVPVQAGEVSALLSPLTFEGIPRRVSDQQGNAGDMVNFALLGTQTQVEAAFKAAGWVAVDKSVEDAILHGLMATLSHEAYTEVPMSTLFLFGRPQDLSFARGDPLEVAAVRHHLRVWRTEQKVGGMTLWVGSATHDVGFERDQRTRNGVTHKIDPEIDLERQFVLESFDAAGMFRSAAYVTPADPLREARTATGGSFRSDGRILVMELK